MSQPATSMLPSSIQVVPVHSTLGALVIGARASLFLVECCHVITSTTAEIVVAV